MKPIGLVNDTAFSGIEVYAIEHDIIDKVKFKRFRPLNGKTVRSKMLTATIKVDIDGAHFTSAGTKYYFSEIMKVN
jgi:hypothetical protein